MENGEKKAGRKGGRKKGSNQLKLHRKQSKWRNPTLASSMIFSSSP